MQAGKKGLKTRKKVPLVNNIVLNTNLWFACEKCQVINQRMQQQEKHLYEPLSPSPSPTCSEESSTFSPSLSLTPINASPSVSPIGTNYCDLEYRCSDCQVMMREFHQQLQQEIQAEDQSEEDGTEEEDYFSGYIDDINMDILEDILARMPRLTTLKFAQG